MANISKVPEEPVLLFGSRYTWSNKKKIYRFGERGGDGRQDTKGKKRVVVKKNKAGTEGKGLVAKTKNRTEKKKSKEKKKEWKKKEKKNEKKRKKRKDKEKRKEKEERNEKKMIEMERKGKARKGKWVSGKEIWKKG